ncbi:hypothetical protein ACHAW6_010280 [Cyclotella cf. meneghiniana]
MVMAEIDGNAVLVKGNNQMITLTIAMTENSGMKPKHQILDNEASEEYKQTILDNELTYQLVLPDMH